jgi:hypothetical protein
VAIRDSKSDFIVSKIWSASFEFWLARMPVICELIN